MVGEGGKYTNFGHAKKEKETLVIQMLNELYRYRACSEFTIGLQIISKTRIIIETRCEINIWFSFYLE